MKTKKIVPFGTPEFKRVVAAGKAQVATSRNYSREKGFEFERNLVDYIEELLPSYSLINGRTYDSSMKGKFIIERASYIKCDSKRGFADAIIVNGKKRLRIEARYKRITSDLARMAYALPFDSEQTPVFLVHNGPGWEMETCANLREIASRKQFPNFHVGTVAEMDSFLQKWA